jgi:hypothetical protein
VFGALFSAGIAATMLATAAAHGPTPDPHPARTAVVVVDGRGTRETGR